MLKSGKLKLADDMIVTAQEAVNKAETVFTIYDDTTNTQIASGPIGGGGGGGETSIFKIETKNTYNTADVGYMIEAGFSITNMEGEPPIDGSIALVSSGITGDSTPAATMTVAWKDAKGVNQFVTVDAVHNDSKWTASIDFSEREVAPFYTESYNPSVLIEWNEKAL